MGGCDGAINLLQTKSAYRSQLIDPVSFLQMEEEVGFGEAGKKLLGKVD